MARIVELHIENVKRIQHLHLRLPAGVTQITGRNAQGKSTILDAIAYALCGKRDIPEMPVRRGAEAEGAEITIDIGDKVITRRWSASGNPTLTVESKDGARFKKPQELLDAIKAEFLDPQEFTKLPAAKQIEAIRRCIPIKWADVDAKAAGFAAKLKETNAAAAAAKSNAEMLVREVELAHGGPLDTIPDVLPNLELLGHRTAKIDAIVEQRAKQEAELAALKTQKVALEVRINEARARLEALIGSQDQVEMQIADASVALAEIPDVAEQRAELQRETDNARRLENSVRGAQRVKVARDALRVAQVNVDGVLTEREAWRESLRSEIASHPLPVPGLFITEDGMVMFNGIPLNQASASEQIRIGLGLAASMQSELKLILIRDGSLLDPDSMAAVEAFADEAGVQILIERVTDGGPVGIVIEDGLVAGSAE